MVLRMVAVKNRKYGSGVFSAQLFNRHPNFFANRRHGQQPNVGIGFCLLRYLLRSYIHGKYDEGLAKLAHDAGEEKSRPSVPGAEFDDQGRPERDQNLLIVPHIHRRLVGLYAQPGCLRPYPVIEIPKVVIPFGYRIKRVPSMKCFLKIFTEHDCDSIPGAPNSGRTPNPMSKLIDNPALRIGLIISSWNSPGSNDLFREELFSEILPSGEDPKTTPGAGLPQRAASAGWSSTRSIFPCRSRRSSPDRLSAGSRRSCTSSCASWRGNTEASSGAKACVCARIECCYGYRNSRAASCRRFSWCRSSRGARSSTVEHNTP